MREQVISITTIRGHEKQIRKMIYNMCDWLHGTGRKLESYLMII